MKRVSVSVLDDGVYADYVVRMENDIILIETSDDYGGDILWQFVKGLANFKPDTIESVGAREGLYEDFCVEIQVKKSFKGKFEAVKLLSFFNAAEEISLTGII